MRHVFRTKTVISIALFFGILSNPPSHGLPLDVVGEVDLDALLVEE